MNAKLLSVGLILVMLLCGAACDSKSANSGSSGTPQAAGTQGAGERCAHDIKREKCPFCNPQLVESEGFCGEHGVAEALCAQCRPYLKAAFRAKGDWCSEHSVPDSQCVQCHPELKEKILAGEHGAAAGKPAEGAGPAACPHGIETAQCPFCTPTLVQTEGFCEEHDIAEALCVRCRPYLETAFKAKDDWCGEHATPESQCVLCHPELKSKPKSED